MYRVLIAIPLFQNNELRSKAMMIASGSAAVVNLILIMALGKVYEKLALKLTQWGKGPCALSESEHFTRPIEFLTIRSNLHLESEFTSRGFEKCEQKVASSGNWTHNTGHYCYRSPMLIQ